MSKTRKKAKEITGLCLVVFLGILIFGLAVPKAVYYYLDGWGTTEAVGLFFRGMVAGGVLLALFVLIALLSAAGRNQMFWQLLYLVDNLIQRDYPEDHVQATDPILRDINFTMSNIDPEGHPPKVHFL